MALAWSALIVGGVAHIKLVRCVEALSSLRSCWHHSAYRLGGCFGGVGGLSVIASGGNVGSTGLFLAPQANAGSGVIGDFRWLGLVLLLIKFKPEP